MCGPISQANVSSGCCICKPNVLERLCFDDVAVDSPRLLYRLGWFDACDPNLNCIQYEIPESPVCVACDAQESSAPCT